MDQHDFLKILIKESLERQLLYEGLIFSYSPQVVITKLRKKGFKGVIYNGKTINISLQLSNNNSEIYEGLNNFLQNVCGWFHGVSITNSTPTKDKLDFINHKSGTVILQYEPKFDMEITNIPDNLYHLTTCDKLKKILNVGLTPRTSTEYFNFENRIYLSNNKEKLINFTKQKSILTKNECFVILKINLNGFTDRIRFFSDPNFNDGFYTLENIPKSTIEPIETITMENENDLTIKPFDN